MTTPISTILKEGTADLHVAAERHPLQAALVRGQLSRQAFVAFLGQMLLLHRALEASIRRASSALGPGSALARVISADQFQEVNLRADLRHFGADPDAVAPLPATERAIADLEGDERQRPLALLGWWYVTEGSKNGATFIAKALRKVYALTPGEGDRYWDPYGATQRERWAAWKQAIDAADLSDADRAHALAAAKRMFSVVAEIGDDLVRHLGLNLPAAGAAHGHHHGGHPHHGAHAEVKPAAAPALRP